MSADLAIPPRMQANRICIVPNVAGVGGMVSFKYKLLEGLAKRGISASQDLNDTPYQSVLVIGGARQLWGLWRARQRGARTRAATERHELAAPIEFSRISKSQPAPQAAR